MSYLCFRQAVYQSTSKTNITLTHNHTNTSQRHTYISETVVGFHVLISVGMLISPRLRQSIVVTQEHADGHPASTPPPSNAAITMTARRGCFQKDILSGLCLLWSGKVTAEVVAASSASAPPTKKPHKQHDGITTIHLLAKHTTR